MGVETSIGWCDHTYNPWWGCVRVSPACEHCYAETFAKRTGHAVWGVAAPRRVFGEKHWAEPLKWNREAREAGVRRRVFCASMCDVFEDRRDLDHYRARLWPLIEKCDDLDWLLLTKRPENMVALTPRQWEHRWPEHVWAGATTESQEWLEKRWPHLLAVPAATRFISAEPLLGPLRLLPPGPEWVIVGGESGPGARWTDPDWIESLAYQCRYWGLKLFVKQLGVVEAKRRLPIAAWKSDRKGETLTSLPAGLRTREWP